MHTYQILTEEGFPSVREHTTKKRGRMVRVLFGCVRQRVIPVFAFAGRVAVVVGSGGGGGGNGPDVSLIRRLLT